MKTNTFNQRSLKQNPSRLAAYLATGIGAGLVAMPMAEAAIVTIDITTNGFGIDGPNAGLTGGSNYKYAPDFPISGAGKLFASNYPNDKGIRGFNGLSFACGAALASPINFAFDQSIGSSFSWSQFNSNKNYFRTVLGQAVINSPDFGSGSYMGFKTAQGNFGWLEVTWAGATGAFRIYSGAYESDAGVAILAGDTGGGTSAVPEPGQVASSLLLLALGSAGVAIQRQRAKKKQAAALAQS
jgi:hypothetical protein